MLSWEEFEEKEKEIQPVKAQIPEKKAEPAAAQNALRWPPVDPGGQPCRR